MHRTHDTRHTTHDSKYGMRNEECVFNICAPRKPQTANRNVCPCVFVSLCLCVLALISGVCLAQEYEPPLSYYEVIEKRNFFRPKEDQASEKTKKEQEQAAAAASQPRTITDLVLTGIVKVRGRYKAILEKAGSSEGFYVGIGDTVEDYTVQDIQQDGVIISRGDQEYVLKLKGTSMSNGPVEAKTPADTAVKKKEDAGSDTEDTKFEPNAINRLRMGGKNEK